MSKIIDHTDRDYEKKWRSQGFQRYNGAYYYSTEIVKNIIPHIHTDRNWVTVQVVGKCFDHSIVFIHNNKNPERYAWLKKYKDLILVCGVPETCKKVEKFGTPIYLPLSVDVEEIRKHIHSKVNKRAFAGRKPKRQNIKFLPGTEYIEDLPRDLFLDKMSEYEEIYAVGRSAIEAKVLDCNVLAYDPRYPDPSIWKVVDNKDVVPILQAKLDQIEKDRLKNKVASKNIHGPKSIKPSNSTPIIIDHTWPKYIQARNKIGKNRWNGAYYYSKEIVQNIIPNVKTDRNWITIKSGEDAVDHSIVFVHNNVNFENAYEYLKKYKDIIYVVGLPDMLERASKFGKAVYLPLSVDVNYVKKFKREKTKEVAFVGRKEVRVRSKYKFSKDVDFIEGLSREELLSKMAEYKKIYAIGRTAIEGRILGCEILPYHPRLQDPSIWKVLDNKDAAKILQKALDKIDNKR